MPKVRASRAGQDVEERLFLDRIAGQHADVSVRDEQRAVVVEAHPADAVAAGLDDAAVPAGEALDRAVGLALDQRLGGRGGIAVQHVLEGFEALLIFVENFQCHDRYLDCAPRYLDCSLIIWPLLTSSQSQLDRLIETVGPDRTSADIFGHFRKLVWRLLRGNRTLLSTQIGRIVSASCCPSVYPVALRVFARICSAPRWQFENAVLDFVLCYFALRVARKNTQRSIYRRSDHGEDLMALAFIADWLGRRRFQTKPSDFMVFSTTQDESNCHQSSPWRALVGKA